MTEVSDLVGELPAVEVPAPVEPVAPITADTPDPVGALDALAAVEAVGVAIVDGEVHDIPPGITGNRAEVLVIDDPITGTPNLEGALAAAEAVSSVAPVALEAPDLFPSSEGPAIVNRIPPPEAKPRVEHRPRDDRGFRYAWQRSRADGRRF